MPDLPGSPLRVRLVGDLRIERGAAVLRAGDLGSRKARTVLGLLAGDRDRARTAGEIAAVLWPDHQPRTAEATVASLVSRLRRCGGAPLIVGSRRGYRLGALPDVVVDLDEAATLATEAERRLAAGQPGLAVAATAAALDLLVGTALADAGDDAPWADAARARHAAVLRRCRHAAGRARLEIGDHLGAADIARAGQADDPLDEESARTLMTALAAMGEPAAALHVFVRLRRRLADTLGTDPAPETAALHARILRGTLPRAPRPTGPGPSGPLVGREAEFGVLQRAWTSAAAGSGALVLVTGEAGAGKTRLADEVARLAGETGGTVLSARCYEAERALFLQPLVEAISGVVARRSPAQILAACSQHRDSLARLIPEIGTLVGALPRAVARADVERRRAVQAVSALLAGLAHDGPVLLLLDDLHNAGASTVELLHFLRTTLPTAALLVIATLRTDEGAETLATLAPVAARVDVGPLPNPAVRQLAVDAGQGHRAADIVRRTGGHALFVTEILRASGGDELPATLQAAVLARVERAGRGVEAMLRAGAVLGAAFDPQHAATLAGITPARGLTYCERAAQAGLLRPAGRDYEFANDLLREVLYATSPDPTRRAQHARAMDLLADAPEQMAAHARAIEDWPRAARAWLRAAEEALAAFAAPDAAALATRAAAAADRADALDLYGRALLLRAIARETRSEYAGAWDDLAGAATAARTAGDQRLEMLVMRDMAGDIPVALGNPPASVEPPLRRCLHLAATLGDPAVEAEALERLTVLAVSRLDFVQALQHSAGAVRAADAVGQDAARERALDARKACFAYLGEIDRLTAVVDELEPLNRRSGNLWLLQWTLFESAFVPLSAGEHDAACARIEAALAVNRRSGYEAFEPFFVAHLAWVRRLAGDLTAALDLGADAVRAARGLRHVWWLSTAASLHAATLLQAGRADDALALLHDVVPTIEADGTAGYLARCLGPLAEATGDLDVVERADALLRNAAVPPGSAWLLGADCQLAVARAWRAHGRPERAAAVLAPFLAAARRVGWRQFVQVGEDALR